jgi:hypothetical protein
MPALSQEHILRCPLNCQYFDAGLPVGNLLAEDQAVTQPPQSIGAGWERAGHGEAGIR